VVAVLTAACSSSSYGSEHIDSFDTAWATIDQEFYDPEFAGVDWDGMRDRYRPLALDARDHEEFLLVVNEMLFQLGVSHTGVLPAEDLEQLDPILTSPGWAGFDVRLIGDVCVVTEVEPGSPADVAGLRPGFVLASVSGESVEEIVANVPPVPPVHERGRRSAQTNQVRERLYGEPQTELQVTYRDDGDEIQETTLSLVSRGSSSEITPELPPAYTELTVSRLEGGIGYIAFNAFLPNLLEPISDAIGEMTDARGLVIDLRGNHGGVFPVREALVDQLVDKPNLIWTYRTRDEPVEVYAEPTSSPYDGPLVVIVDVLSASSAEEFAGALQAMGRAVIVGERTAGRVLVQTDVQLPNGDLMIYPFAQTMVSDGTVLESHGVIPDWPAPLSREELLAGNDTPLETAIGYVESQPAGR
jgi:carboxyl-terminal processing protease